MKRYSWRWAAGLAPLTLLVLWAMLAVNGQAQAPAFSTQNGEWQTYGGDLKSTRYSPLDQINADNFNKIEVAWRFKTDALGPRPEFNLQATPLMVKGVMYTVGGTRRAAVALDAATGEMLWMHTINEGKRGESAPRQLSGRGLSYWTDGREERILYVTPGYQLVALNAKTGEPVRTFGKDGMVDLKTEDDQNSEQSLDAFVTEPQSRSSLTIDLGGTDYPIEGILAYRAIVGNLLDVEKTPVGLEANLPQSRQVLQ